MEKSLAYLEGLMVDEERCLKRLIKLSRWEQSRLTWGQQKMLPPLLEMKSIFIQRLRLLELERRKLRAQLAKTFEGPRDLSEKIHVTKLEVLGKKMNKDAETLVRINHENALLMQNTAMRKLRDDYNHHQDVRGIYEPILSNLPMGDMK